jgi:GT2 family glycosyltransferase
MAGDRNGYNPLVRSFRAVGQARRDGAEGSAQVPCGARPRVTTVVMTRDRWPDLSTSLPHHEGPVVLVDNGSRDGTPRLVRRHFPHVTVVELDANVGAQARNVGVQRARTPYVAFADDDSWWTPGALTVAADHFDRHPRLGLVAARILVGDDERLDPTCGVMAQSPLGTASDLPGPSVLGFVACGSVVRRRAFLRAGGFDEVVFFAGEEERVALDLVSDGWGLSYVDDVVAHHHPSRVRDPAAREALIRRNRLLTALMRRPWSVVNDLVRDDLRAGPRARQAAAAALVRSPRALRRRRAVPVAVERALRRLEVDAAYACP